MIIALAGRRISRPGAQPQRFPDSCADAVRDELTALFQEHGATALVGSGACGADLLAMEAAGALGMERHLVIAFDRARFRARSVADAEYDRDWGAIFDRVADEVEARDGLIVITPEGDDHAADHAVNHEILHRADGLSREPGNGRVLAVIVWDGQSRGPEDVTAAFLHESDARGFGRAQVRTTDVNED